MEEVGEAEFGHTLATAITTNILRVMLQVGSWKTDAYASLSHIIKETRVGGNMLAELDKNLIHKAEIFQYESISLIEESAHLCCNGYCQEGRVVFFPTTQLMVINRG